MTPSEYYGPNGGNQPIEKICKSVSTMPRFFIEGQRTMYSR